MPEIAAETISPSLALKTAIKHMDRTIHKYLKPSRKLYANCSKHWTDYSLHAGLCGHFYHSFKQSTFLHSLSLVCEMQRKQGGRRKIWVVRI